MQTRRRSADRRRVSFSFTFGERYFTTTGTFAVTAAALPPLTV